MRDKVELAKTHLKKFADQVAGKLKIWKAQAHQKGLSVAQNINKEKLNKDNFKKLFDREKFKTTFNKENLQRLAQNFDPYATLEKISAFVQKRGTGFYGTLATIILSTYFIADLTALVVGEYIPLPTPVRSGRQTYGTQHVKSFNDYLPIFTRNLFNSKGLIPGEEAPDSGASSDAGGPPVKSNLPFNLIGTLVLSNELLSVATIEDKSASIVYPVQIGDEIPEKIKVTKIEPKRVTFLNKANNRREYIELPEDSNSLNPKIVAGKPTTGIERTSSTQFNISRSEVDKATADLNNILTQARAVPNFENGVAAGYKLFQIVPGSIYDKLGLQNGDVISGLNGQPINDPGKAFEMLSELKTSNHLELQVKKAGKTLTYTYDIH